MDPPPHNKPQQEAQEQAQQNNGQGDYMRPYAESPVTVTVPADASEQQYTYIQEPEAHHPVELQQEPQTQAHSHVIAATNAETQSKATMSHQEMSSSAAMNGHTPQNSTHSTTTMPGLESSIHADGKMSVSEAVDMNQAPRSTSSSVTQMAAARVTQHDSTPVSDAQQEDGFQPPQVYASEEFGVSDSESTTTVDGKYKPVAHAAEVVFSVEADANAAYDHQYRTTVGPTPGTTIADGDSSSQFSHYTGEIPGHRPTESKMNITVTDEKIAPPEPRPTTQRNAPPDPYGNQGEVGKQYGRFTVYSEKYMPIANWKRLMAANQKHRRRQSATVTNVRTTQQYSAAESSVTVTTPTSSSYEQITSGVTQFPRAQCLPTQQQQQQQQQRFPPRSHVGQDQFRNSLRALNVIRNALHGMGKELGFEWPPGAGAPAGQGNIPQTTIQTHMSQQTFQPTTPSPSFTTIQGVSEIKEPTKPVAVSEAAGTVVTTSTATTTSSSTATKDDGLAKELEEKKNELQAVEIEKRKAENGRRKLEEEVRSLKEKLTVTQQKLARFDTGGWGDSLNVSTAPLDPNLKPQ
eukprot:gb/GECG01011616.1/.p1 GENE.gb/GECG01011616.1/~~gb/GECG01011616.1/.p1  ORF type:complete len:576 (+),score=100.83 gb/GECG01011616.1/:1-1728(+)